MKRTMKKVFIIIGLLLAVALPAQATSAVGRPNLTTSVVKPSGQIVKVPEKATEVAPDVFYIGDATDPVTNQAVQGYAFVTPKPSQAKPSERPGGNTGGTTTSSCYAFTSKGALWKSQEEWVVAPANNAGLDELYVFDTITNGIGQWQDAADGKIDGNKVSIFGNGTTTASPLTLDTSSPDGVNEVLFGSIDGDSAIAVTYVWGVFGGSPNNRSIIEWDMIFDQESFSWTDNGGSNAGSMDFANIATHELGHAFGLTHPGDSCVDETMFRFASSGETKKIDLNAGDITGISTLY